MYIVRTISYIIVLSNLVPRARNDCFLHLDLEGRIIMVANHAHVMVKAFLVLISSVGNTGEIRGIRGRDDCQRLKWTNAFNCLPSFDNQRVS